MNIYTGKTTHIKLTSESRVVYLDSDLTPQDTKAVGEFILPIVTVTHKETVPLTRLIVRHNWFQAKMAIQKIKKALEFKLYDLISDLHFKFDVGSSPNHLVILESAPVMISSADEPYPGRLIGWKGSYSIGMCLIHGDLDASNLSESVTLQALKNPEHSEVFLKLLKTSAGREKLAKSATESCILY